MTNIIIKAPFAAIDKSKPLNFLNTSIGFYYYYAKITRIIIIT